MTAKRAGGARRRRKIPNDSITKLWELLERFAAAALAVNEADEGPGLQAAEQEFCHIREEVLERESDLDAFVEKLISAAAGAVPEEARQNRYIEYLLRLARWRLFHYCERGYQPEWSSLVRTPTDVFTDPFERLSEDSRDNKLTQRLAVCLRTCGAGEVTLAPQFRPHGATNREIYDPSALYRGARDPIDILHLLLDFRARASQVAGKDDWSLWTRGTERDRGLAFARLRHVETGWCADATEKGGQTLPAACALFDVAKGLAADLADLPDKFPGKRDLKKSISSLQARYKSVHRQFSQIESRVSAENFLAD